MATPPRGPADYLELGDWNAACYQCGRKFKASQLKKHWQGFWVCPQHWEARHPQDFVRSIVDNMTPPWAQPPSDTYALFCTPNGISAIADFGVADCAINDYISPAFDPNVT
jgi:hypothetical protein